MSVIWITGLSGSGKTTLAEKLCAHLRGVGQQVVLLDGDKLRSILLPSEDELKFADSLGHVDRKEDFYEKIDILIHPAKREAYGMVIAEALSIGIPVICSQETGASELLNLEHTLNYQDTIGLWCDVLKGILAQPSDNFPKRAKINSWQHVASKYYSNYKELLDEN